MPSSTLEVCWICKACKGNQHGADLGFAYSNISEGAAWRSSYWSEAPYSVEPEFLQIPGFCLQMLQPDVLHICHLGTGRDLLGAAMRQLTRTECLFQGRTQLLRLRDATTRLREFAHQNGYSMSLRRLSSKSLNFTTDRFPELKAKGFDTFVVLRWLVTEVTSHKPANFDLLCTCLWSLDSFLSVATNASRFFTEQEANHLKTVGSLFLKAYLHLAIDAIRRKRKLYRIRPKFHLMSHLIYDIPASRSNFTYHSTWLDEDFNKVVMTITKQVHKRTACRSTINRWLLALPEHLEHAAVVQSR